MTVEKKRKVLVFIDWYLPGYKAGGPIRSCANMVSRMEPYFHFKVITGNADLGETTPYAGIRSDEWNTLPGGEEVFYCSRKMLSHSNIDKIVRDEKPDVIYLNSMFSQWFTMVPLIVAKRYGLARVVIAPRGMLSPGALMLKATKKKLFLSFAKVMGLFKGVTWHASNPVEVAEIHKVFGNSVRIIHAMNLTPENKTTLSQRKKTVGEAKLIYIGRITAVKNLLQNIEVLQQLPDNCKVVFEIYGPVDDPSYLDQCQGAISKLRPNVTAKFMGPVDNSQVPALLASAHFLYLLTFNENFGHAIVEGLMAGCPAIISDRTPWKQLESKQCGWDLALDNETAILRALQLACAMDQGEYNEWSASAAAFARNITGNKEHLENTMKLFS